MEQTPKESTENRIDDINKAHRMAEAESPYHDQIAELKSLSSTDHDDYTINRLEYRAKRAGEKADENYEHDNDPTTLREEDSQRAHRIALAEKPYRDQIVDVEKESDYFGLGTLRSLGRRAFDAGNLAAANHDADVNPATSLVEDVDKAQAMASAIRPTMERALKTKAKIEHVEDGRDSDMSYAHGFSLIAGTHKTLTKIPTLRQKLENLRNEADAQADVVGEKYDLKTK